MRIGRWQFDSEQRTLSSGSKCITLTPRNWQVLSYLLEFRGKLVRTETLLAKFWHGRNSEEAYVRKSISEIRKALGEDVRSPKFIKTVSKQGYLFSQESVFESGEHAAVAVLPFANISNDADGENFCDGLTEEILSRLTQKRNTPVVAATPSLEFKEKNLDIRSIGRLLKTRHILEGSVRKVADSVKVTARLIDTLSGEHLWSHACQHTLGDFFTVQDEIAEDISQRVQNSITIDEGTSQPTRLVYVSKRFINPDEFSQIVKTISDLQKPD
ncbi:MAG: TolB-like protein [Candidatus Azotimanducaceae bacterium]|jgi:TolB-like protein